MTWLPDTLRSWVEYHAQMWDFHTHLTTPHDYAAKAFTWMIQWRPTSFFYESPEPAQQACGSDRCSQAITSLGNPLIWWLGCIAIVAAIYWIVTRRDAIFAATLTGLGAGWLPWFLFPERTIFTFYAIVMLPFVALTLTWAGARFLGLDQPETGFRDAPAMAAGDRRHGRHPDRAGDGVLLPDLDRDGGAVLVLAGAHVDAQLGVNRQGLHGDLAGHPAPPPARSTASAASWAVVPSGSAPHFA